jgi:hypothetical protein
MGGSDDLERDGRKDPDILAELEALGRKRGYAETE